MIQSWRASKMGALVLLCWMVPIVTVYGASLSEQFKNGRAIKFIVYGSDSCSVERVSIPEDELFEWVTFTFFVIKDYIHPIISEACKHVISHKFISYWSNFLRNLM